MLVTLDAKSLAWWLCGPEWAALVVSYDATTGEPETNNQYYVWKLYIHVLQTSAVQVILSEL